jgi:hypothetical protein
MKIIDRIKTLLNAIAPWNSIFLAVFAAFGLCLFTFLFVDEAKVSLRAIAPPGYHFELWKEGTHVLMYDKEGKAVGDGTEPGLSGVAPIGYKFVVDKTGRFLELRR